MKRFFILTAAVIFIAGCAGTGGETSGMSGSAGTSSSYTDPSSTYFGD